MRFSALNSTRLEPRYWALATLLIPIANGFGYGVWLVVDNLATSTRAEELVRTGVYAVMSTVFTLIPRPWARAIAVAFAVALALWLSGVIQFEVFRGA